MKGLIRMRDDIINFDYTLEQVLFDTKYVVKLIVEYEDGTKEQLGKLLFDSKQKAINYIKSKLIDFQEFNSSTQDWIYFIKMFLSALFSVSIVNLQPSFDKIIFISKSPLNKFHISIYKEIFVICESITFYLIFIGL